MIDWLKDQMFKRGNFRVYASDLKGMLEAGASPSPVHTKQTKGACENWSVFTGCNCETDTIQISRKVAEMWSMRNTYTDSARELICGNMDIEVSKALNDK